MASFAGMEAGGAGVAEVDMSRISEAAVMQWRRMQPFIQRLDRLCTRNAFSDARRAQAARLLAQQAGPPLGQYPYDAFRFATERRNLDR
jgi:hypothetical protein